jgi:hypothetical protein
LFLKGVENEQNGKLYEAIQFYRRAVQLVPDIEFRLYDASKLKPRERQEMGIGEGNSYFSSGWCIHSHVLLLIQTTLVVMDPQGCSTKIHSNQFVISEVWLN